MKPSELELVKRKFPLSQSTITINQAEPDGVRAQKPECPEGKALECDASGKAKGVASADVRAVPKKRYRIWFHVFAVRPCDWDNYCGNGGIKHLQDGLVASGLLPGDSFDVLEGSVSSHKVKTRAEERTDVVIEPL